ncbi:DMT family transporter [Neotabrizicola shimadae]|uniref:DMT family transporter n=1 Tax=Neotabrizicola shimadae TaxID=2807096 RepID=A0A8G1EDX5_9RHOB|nr:DMT family transporter [Neotabrizicola shimadae]QYZ69899.1 DMT family transporter [Neotabrizicola shimadae]
MPALSPNLRGALLALAAFCLYACCDVAVKGLGLGMTSLQVMFFVAAGSLPWILGQALLSRPRARLTPALPGLTALRVAIIIGNGVLVTYAFTELPLAECYAIFFTMPLMVTLLAWPILGEPIDPRRGLVVLMGFLGVLIALNPQATDFKVAHLAAFGGATLGAMNSIMLRMIGSRESTAVMLLYPTAAQFMAAALFMPLVWVPPTAMAFGLALGIGLLGTMAGFAIIAAYRLAPAIVVAPMQYSQIIWASALGILFFDEWPGSMAVAGISVIIAAGVTLLAMAQGRVRTA